LNNKIYIVIFVLKVGKPKFNSLAESGQKTLKVGIHNMGVGSGGEGAGRGRSPPWIFIDDTDKIEAVVALGLGELCAKYLEGPFPMGSTVRKNLSAPYMRKCCDSDMFRVHSVY